MASAMRSTEFLGMLSAVLLCGYWLGMTVLGRMCVTKDVFERSVRASNVALRSEYRRHRLVLLLLGSLLMNLGYWIYLAA